MKLIPRKITDEEVFKQLLENKNEDIMDADEWKKLRLIELKKIGRNWTK